MENYRFKNFRFADADSDYNDSSYIILGIPLEATTSFRKGTKFGPSEIRRASHCFESYNRRNDIDLKEISICDLGDIGCQNKTKNVIEFSSGAIEDIYKNSKTPILIGGEHTVSISGFKGTDASSFIVLDAHLDLKENFMGRKYNHGSVSRIAVEHGLETVIIGARSGSKKEWGFADKENIEIYEIDDIQNNYSELINRLKNYKDPYFSLDLDVLDPGFVSGVGTPEPFGLYPQVVRDIIEDIAPLSIGFDVVEMSPKNGSGCFLAAKLIQDYISSKETKNKQNVD